MKELGASEQLMENSRKSLKGAYGVHLGKARRLATHSALGAGIGRLNADRALVGLYKRDKVLYCRLHNLAEASKEHKQWAGRRLSLFDGDDKSRIENAWRSLGPHRLHTSG